MKQPMRVRLSGAEYFEKASLFCECCGQAIIKDHKATTPIYYMYEENERVLCKDCK